MHVVRRAWALTAGGYGVAATAVVLLVVLLRDSTVLTYTAGLLSFWWLLPALPLVLVSLALRTWRTAAVLTVPALVWLTLHGSPLPGRADGPRDLRVATFNVEPYLDMSHVGDLVTTSDPDVLLLQEVRPEVHDDLAALLPEHPYQWFAPVVDAADFGGGTAVVSRYPITGVDPVTGLPEGARPTAVVTLDVAGRALRAVPVHLASPCFGCTSEQAEANPAGGADAAARVRVAEARRYADLVDGLTDTGPVVLGGDINSAELNEPLQLLRGAGLVDAHREAGTGPGLTRAPAPGLARIDVVLVAGLEVLASTEGEAGRSSHSPVVVDLAWPPQGRATP